MNLTTVITGANISKSILLAGVKTKANFPRTVYQVGARVRTRVRHNASTGYHRPGEPHIPGTGPGPNVATGDYRRAISQFNGLEGSEPLSVVYTNEPQALTLEYGPLDGGQAYPHWRPAMQQAYDWLQEAAAKEVKKAAGIIAANRPDTKIIGGGP